MNRISAVTTALFLSAALASHGQFVRRVFTSVEHLALNGAAALVDGRIRLVPAREGQGGSAWFTTQQSVVDGFDVTFVFQITDPGSNPPFPPGADGLAFVLQNSSTREGGIGGGIGYDGIRNSFAVEFDTYDNNPDGNPEPNNNHVSVHSQGLNANSVNHSTSMGWSTNIPRLASGLRHTARVYYAPGRLEVYLDDMQDPAVVVNVAIDSLLRLSEGKCWMGFTAATGQSWANFDLVEINCGVTMTLRNILFDHDRSVLKPESRTELDRLLVILNDDDRLHAEIAGHTDSNGDEIRNLQLSTARAEAVRAWLVAKGIEPRRLTTHGFGEARPVADNATDAGRAKNRRVDARLWREE